MDSKGFSIFQDLVKFLSTEAEIICNPITLHALHSRKSPPERRVSNEVKRNKAIVYKTQTIVNGDKQIAKNVMDVSRSNSNLKIKVPP